MANPTITEIITKILLRNDVYENWQISTLILEKGEAAIEFNPKTLMSKIKIGDGTRTFSQLPYSTLTPDEIQKMIDDSVGYTEGGAVNSVSLSSGTNNGTLKLTINGDVFDNIAVTGLGSAAYTDASDYATAEQGRHAELSMVFKGFTSVLPDSYIATGDTYSVTSALTIPAAVSATNSDVTVDVGALITVTAYGKWATLTSGAGSSIPGGGISTDTLVQGSKTIIFNGGSAST